MTDYKKIEEVLLKVIPVICGFSLIIGTIIWLIFYFATENMDIDKKEKWKKKKDIALYILAAIFFSSAIGYGAVAWSASDQFLQTK